MESLYKPFLELIPFGGAILDAGCGPGRDVLAFLKKGFRVTAFDASAKMVELASKQTGVAAFQMRFQELNYEHEFDGIWACASLLHVPFFELDDILSRFSRALKTGGICFMSFKHGNGERFEDGRQFIDFTEATLRQKLADIPGLSVLRIWGTEDQAGRVGFQWVNALVRSDW
jgi:2-polyprenyl-3-methyl-5-hydroxy-6-metoxy-1,4-benzoquinol methylase